MSASSRLARSRIFGMDAPLEQRCRRTYGDSLHRHHFPPVSSMAFKSACLLAVRRLPLLRGRLDRRSAARRSFSAVTNAANFIRRPVQPSSVFKRFAALPASASGLNRCQERALAFCAARTAITWHINVAQRFATTRKLTPESFERNHLITRIGVLKRHIDCQSLREFFVPYNGNRGL